jgi:hypothetical protein
MTNTLKTLLSFKKHEPFIEKYDNEISKFELLYEINMF